MPATFDLKDFLTCPQGPRLEGEERIDACRALGQAISRRQIMTAAQLLMQDPSLIAEKVSDEPYGWRHAVELAISAGMDALVLFALEHGMPVTDPRFGKPGGLLEAAVKKHSPDLVSCALLYQADPNQIDLQRNCSLLEEIVTFACSEKSDGWPFMRAMRIAHMLLDAGADPLSPVDGNTSIFSLCLNNWHFPDAFGEMFAEALKRTRNVRDLQIDGVPIAELAATRRNVPALELVIKAGAYTYSDKLLRMAMDYHIKNLIQLRQADQSGRSPDAALSSQLPQINLAPRDFLTTQQGTKLTGNDRATRCQLLYLAIKQNRFVTVTKILSDDPSLITEELINEDNEDISAIEYAITKGMAALIPFALAQGMSIDDPAFGNSKGLLDVGIHRSSLTLMSYALLNNADPNQIPVELYDDNLKTFIDIAIEDRNAGWEGNTKGKSASRVARMSTMLLDAGAKPFLPGAANTGLPLLAAKSWFKDDELDILFTEMLSRGGSSCANIQENGLPILLIAVKAKNIRAVKLLIEAGANTDREVLGADLFKILKDNGLGAHIPALTELVMRLQIERGHATALGPTVTIVAGQGEPDVAPPRSRKLTPGHVF